MVKKLEQEFRDRWTNEYVTLQQRRNKWAEVRTNLQPGDCVLIKDELMPPGRWMMGRIKEAYSGSDGFVRSCLITTAYGELIRPIVKLCLLPFNEEEEDAVEPVVPMEAE